jgi:hypothetical protein
MYCHPEVKTLRRSSGPGNLNFRSGIASAGSGSRCPAPGAGIAAGQEPRWASAWSWDRRRPEPRWASAWSWDLRQELATKELSIRSLPPPRSSPSRARHQGSQVHQLLPAAARSQDREQSAQVQHRRQELATKDLSIRNSPPRSSPSGARHQGSQVHQLLAQRCRPLQSVNQICNYGAH